MRYAIRTKNGLLNGFYTNDLPITKRLYFNENTDRLEPKFSLRNMMNCSDGYMFFGTPEEAQRHINYIRNDVKQNKSRYEKSLQGSTDQLLSIIDKFKVVSIKP